MQKILEGFQYWVASRQRTISKYYLVGLIVIFSAVILSWTIGYADTDMWYHLAGGRFLFEHGSPYNPFSNSYLEPAREFINYFWGFQGIIYLVWLAAGPLGLIALKTLLLVFCALFIIKILLSGLPFNRATALQLLVISLSIVLLCAKGTSIRPHLFSYFFISAFIYILLYRDKWLPVLPLLTIVWINTHGVEWVISALIGGSYVIKKLLDYIRTRNYQHLKSTYWVLACIPALLVNPFGIYVLLAPFVPSSQIYLFISELQPFVFLPVINLAHGLNSDIVLLALMLFYVAALIHALRDVYKNIFALLLAIGGAILLFRASRFIWEWLLLSSPLFSIALSAWSGPKFDVKTFFLLLALPILMFYPFWLEHKSNISRYPLDENSYPLGTTEFIHKLQITGRYALSPSYAGYIEWVLSPEVKIHSDMQFGPFDENDLFEIRVSNITQSGFQSYVDKYQPDLFAVDKENRAFPTIAGTQETYVPVFFDHKLVLYINRDHYPKIAEEYEIKFLDPFNTDKIRKKDLDQGIGEIKRMLAVINNVPELKITLIGFLIEKGDLEEAQTYLSPLLYLYPDNESVLFFSARTAFLNENYELALDYYLALLPLATDQQMIKILTAECYFMKGDLQHAYKMYKSAINPYRDSTFDSQNYYQFALSSYVVGDRVNALRLLKMIEFFDDDSTPEIRKLVSDLKHTILEEDA